MRKEEKEKKIKVFLKKGKRKPNKNKSVNFPINQKKNYNKKKKSYIIKVSNLN